LQEQRNVSNQPELSVKDFFAFGNAAAEHTASLAVRYPLPIADRQPEDATPKADEPSTPGNAGAA